MHAPPMLSSECQICCLRARPDNRIKQIVLAGAWTGPSAICAAISPRPELIVTERLTGETAIPSAESVTAA